MWSKGAACARCGRGLVLYTRRGRRSHVRVNLAVVEVCAPAAWFGRRWGERLIGQHALTGGLEDGESGRRGNRSGHAAQ